MDEACLEEKKYISINATTTLNFKLKFKEMKASNYPSNYISLKKIEIGVMTINWRITGGGFLIPSILPGDATGKSIVYLFQPSKDNLLLLGLSRHMFLKQTQS